LLIHCMPQLTGHSILLHCGASMSGFLIFKTI
jgi:hypothetical protein